MDGERAPDQDISISRQSFDCVSLKMALGHQMLSHTAAFKAQDHPVHSNVVAEEGLEKALDGHTPISLGKRRVQLLLDLHIFILLFHHYRKYALFGVALAINLQYINQELTRYIEKRKIKSKDTS
ncbi:hypothetical protein NDU88_000602 [Pleurodeles waltl]|uniref:Uncharacterized protein n=1 Tax=Pleurodeles waltl TaxID=8319 RepID=A0AAV7KMH4_PLEWA|nr:hypothetical protein NDU88_000602 [Pleurodeles waltl]